MFVLCRDVKVYHYQNNYSTSHQSSRDNSQSRCRSNKRKLKVTKSFIDASDLDSSSRIFSQPKKQSTSVNKQSYFIPPEKIKSTPVFQNYEIAKYKQPNNKSISIPYKINRVQSVDANKLMYNDLQQTTKYSQLNLSNIGNQNTIKIKTKMQRFKKNMGIQTNQTRMQKSIENQQLSMTKKWESFYDTNFNDKQTSSKKMDLQFKRNQQIDINSKKLISRESENFAFLSELSRMFPEQSQLYKSESKSIRSKQSSLNAQKNLQRNLQKSSISSTVPKINIINSNSNTSLNFLNNYRARRKQRLDTDINTVVSRYNTSQMQRQSQFIVQQSVIIERNILSNFHCITSINTTIIHTPYRNFNEYLAQECSGILVSIKRLLKNQHHSIDQQLKIYQYLQPYFMNSKNNQFQVLELYQLFTTNNQYSFVKEAYTSNIKLDKSKKYIQLLTKMEKILINLENIGVVLQQVHLYDFKMIFDDVKLANLDRAYLRQNNVSTPSILDHMRSLQKQLLQLC